MSWEYNFCEPKPFDLFDKNGSISSTSSSDSKFIDEFDQSKLLPKNLWSEVKPSNNWGDDYNYYQQQQQLQQQQEYLDQLQQQQQWLQNPLLLQQQANVVSKQLQQLQLQLQQQQQQLELNQNLLTKSQEPLTHENLTKLEISPLNSSNSSIEENKVNTELYKTELCSTFQKTGNCPYGSKCQFAHGQLELKHVDRGSKWRSKPCANWSKTGTCRYGNRCCFRHGN